MEFSTLAVTEILLSWGSEVDIKMNIVFSRQKFHLCWTFSLLHFGGERREISCLEVKQPWDARWRGGEAYLGDGTSLCLSDESPVLPGSAFQGHCSG